jgi:Ca2+-transporting ATPase
VRYLLSSNTGEVFALFANILLGGPLVLLPVQILWMNFVTDGLTAVALGVEPAEPDAMRRPPRRARDPLLDKGALVSTLLLGAYVATATLVLFYAFLDAGDPGAETRARTVAFTTIIVVQKFNVLNFRSLSAPLARVGFLSNPWLLAALALNVGLHLLVVYAPPLQHAFGTAPLRALDWGVIVAAAAPIFLLVEAQKGLKARHAA